MQPGFLDLEQPPRTTRSARRPTAEAEQSCRPGKLPHHPDEDTPEACQSTGRAPTLGGMRKSRFVGREKLDFQLILTMAAYNLVRMRNLGLVLCR